METMTDTPRTNEALAALLDRDGELSEENAPDVLVTLCKAMEREREEALADAAMWKANHDNQVSLKSMLMDRPDLGDRALRIAELIRERDEAREALETGGLLGILDRAGHNRAEAIRERDDARKAAEHYRNLYYLPKDGLSAAKNHPFSWENQTKP